MSELLPPRPVPDGDTQPFWDAVAERRLVIPRCTSCEHWIWQPRPMCARCQSTDIEWLERSGAGTVASWTVLHPPVLPVWSDSIPFVLLLVDIDEAPGVRLVGQMVDDQGELLRGDGSEQGIDFGVPVELRWRTDEAGQILPAWSPR